MQGTTTYIATTPRPTCSLPTIDGQYGHTSWQFSSFGDPWSKFLLINIFQIKELIIARACHRVQHASLQHVTNVTMWNSHLWQKSSLESTNLKTMHSKWRGINPHLFNASWIQKYENDPQTCKCPQFHPLHVFFSFFFFFFSFNWHKLNLNCKRIQNTINPDEPMLHPLHVENHSCNLAMWLPPPSSRTLET